MNPGCASGFAESRDDRLRRTVAWAADRCFPLLPPLAQGGFITGPSVAMVGKDDPEVIVPIRLTS